VSIKEAREAYDICHSIFVCPTKDDYIIHAVDGEMIEKYLFIVEELERTFQQDSPYMVSINIGRIHITIKGR
jgi:hypothetical protein